MGAVAQVNHYAVRSAAEYVLRAERGTVTGHRAGLNSRYGFDYFRRRHWCLEPDVSGVSAAHRARPWLARMLRAPAVRAAHRECVRIWEQRMARVVATSPEWAFLCDHLAGASRWRLRRHLRRARAAGCTGRFWDEAAHYCAPLLWKALAWRGHGVSWRAAVKRALRDHRDAWPARPG